jgi:hypothetical protein
VSDETTSERPVERGPTLLEIAYSNVGMIEGARAMAWVVQWAWTSERLGRDPKVEEVAEMWAVSVPKAYRDQARFRKAFPPDQNPGRIWSFIKDQVEVKRRSKANVGRATAQACSARLPAT